MNKKENGFFDIVKKLDFLGRENNNTSLFFEIYNTGKVNKKYEFQ